MRGGWVSTGGRFLTMVTAAKPARATTASGRTIFKNRIGTRIVVYDRPLICVVLGFCQLERRLDLFEAASQGEIEIYPVF